MDDMLIIITYPSRRMLIGSEEEAARASARHPRSSVRKEAQGWTARWVEVDTVTWCHRSTPDDDASAVEHVKSVKEAQLFRFPHGCWSLDAAHRHAAEVARATTPIYAAE